LQWFSSVFASVSEARFNCFIYLQTYVASIHLDVLKVDRVLHMLQYTWETKGMQAVPAHGPAARAPHGHVKPKCMWEHLFFFRARETAARTYKCGPKLDVRYSGRQSSRFGKATIASPTLEYSPQEVKKTCHNPLNSLHTIDTKAKQSNARKSLLQALAEQVKEGKEYTFSLPASTKIKVKQKRFYTKNIQRRGTAATLNNPLPWAVPGWRRFVWETMGRGSMP
jgi:hypothetical protein